MAKDGKLKRMDRLQTRKKATARRRKVVKMKEKKIKDVEECCTCGESK